jgi:putative aldouronate transport system substrate-binding protein
MTMLNKFYTSGLIYPDWQSATGNSYYHGPADKGEVGYIVNNASGCNDYNNTSNDPNADWVPVKKLLRYEGQVIHVGSRLSRKSYGSDTISTSCENIPLAITWCDNRYSDSGAFLYNYGVEGLTWARDENGNVRLTDFVLKDPYSIGMDGIMIVYTLNQLSECGLEDVTRKYQYDGGEKFMAMNEYWNDFEHDDIYEWPAGLNLSTQQSDEANLYANDINTYISENYLMFVDGSKPFSEWDPYVSGVMGIGLAQVKEIYQKVLDDYLG